MNIRLVSTIECLHCAPHSLVHNATPARPATEVSISPQEASPTSCCGSGRYSPRGASAPPRPTLGDRPSAAYEKVDQPPCCVVNREPGPATNLALPGPKRNQLCGSSSIPPDTTSTRPASNLTFKSHTGGTKPTSTTAAPPSRDDCPANRLGHEHQPRRS
jgi:hypothetical protein